MTGGYGREDLQHSFVADGEGMTTATEPKIKTFSSAVVFERWLAVKKHKKAHVFFLTLNKSNV